MIYLWFSVELHFSRACFTYPVFNGFLDFVPFEDYRFCLFSFHLVCLCFGFIVWIALVRGEES